MEKWMGGWVDGWVGGWVDGWVGGWVDGWVGGWMGGSGERGEKERDRQQLRRRQVQVSGFIAET